MLPACFEATSRPAGWPWRRHDRVAAAGGAAPTPGRGAQRFV